jgi:hypothetical protein
MLDGLDVANRTGGKDRVLSFGHWNPSSCARRSDQQDRFSTKVIDMRCDAATTVEAKEFKPRLESARVMRT